MAGLPTRTTTALLHSLHDAQSPSWDLFDARFRPILHGFARTWGLSDADAADVAQEALAQFSRDYRDGRYQREKGRLSSWLITIARNRIVDAQRALARRGQLSGQTAMLDLADEAHVTREWNLSRERAVLAEAVKLLRETTKTSEATIRAWELHALQQVPPDEVARQCGISVDEVYVAKNRVTKRLREIVAELTAAYEDEP